MTPAQSVYAERMAEQPDMSWFLYTDWLQEYDDDSELLELLRNYFDDQTTVRMTTEKTKLLNKAYCDKHKIPATKNFGRILRSEPIGPFYTKLITDTHMLVANINLLSESPIRKLELLAFNQADLEMILRNHRVGNCHEVTIRCMSQVKDYCKALREMNFRQVRKVTFRGFRGNMRSLITAFLMNEGIYKGTELHATHSSVGSVHNTSSLICTR